LVAFAIEITQEQIIPFSKIKSENPNLTLDQTILVTVPLKREKFRINPLFYCHHSLQLKRQPGEIAT